jgi:hypothetical protein
MPARTYPLGLTHPKFAMPGTSDVRSIVRFAATFGPMNPALGCLRKVLAGLESSTVIDESTTPRTIISYRTRRSSSRVYACSSVEGDRGNDSDRRGLLGLRNVVTRAVRLTRHLWHRLSDSPFPRPCPVNMGLIAREFAFIRADHDLARGKTSTLTPTAYRGALQQSKGHGDICFPLMEIPTMLRFDTPR